MSERLKHISPRDFVVSDTREKGMFVVQPIAIEQNQVVQKTNVNNSNIDTGYGKQNRKPNKRGGGQFGKGY
jgi:hypothetical protein